MNPIKQCYLAYTNSEEYQSPAGIMGDAAEMLPRKEYTALEAGISTLNEKAFVAGFRFAVRLLVNGMR